MRTFGLLLQDPILLQSYGLYRMGTLLLDDEGDDDDDDEISECVCGL